MLPLFPFHTARIFDIWEESYVKNAQTSSTLSYVIAYFGPWYVPLIFLLSGAGTWFRCASVAVATMPESDINC